jgi:hypothetical protein
VKTEQQTVWTCDLCGVEDKGFKRPTAWNEFQLHSIGESGGKSSVYDGIFQVCHKCFNWNETQPKMKILKKNVFLKIFDLITKEQS